MDIVNVSQAIMMTYLVENVEYASIDAKIAQDHKKMNVLNVMMINNYLLIIPVNALKVTSLTKVYAHLVT